MLTLMPPASQNLSQQFEMMLFSEKMGDICGNGIKQLNNLRTHPAVAAAMAAGALRLFGWVYRLQTGTVEMYDEAADKFGPLERAVRAMASP